MLVHHCLYLVISRVGQIIMWFRFISTGQMRFTTVFYCLQADMYAIFLPFVRCIKGASVA
jgi:hypothetical protein